MANSVSSARRKRTLAVTHPRAVEPDLNAALDLALELMAIRGGSGHEAAVAAYITDQLKAAGDRPSDIRHDKAHLRTPLKGEIGSLIFTLAGTAAPAPPAHGPYGHRAGLPRQQAKARRQLCPIRRSRHRPGHRRSRGCAVVLSAAIEILRRGLPHPPLTFYWPIQEEVGLYGAALCRPEAPSASEAGIQLGRRRRREGDDRRDRRIPDGHRSHRPGQPRRHSARRASRHRHRLAGRRRSGAQRLARPGHPWQTPRHEQRGRDPRRRRHQRGHPARPPAPRPAATAPRFAAAS